MQFLQDLIGKQQPLRLVADSIRMHDTRGTLESTWYGLGDDPRRHRLGWEGTRLVVEDQGSSVS